MAGSIVLEIDPAKFSRVADNNVVPTKAGNGYMLTNPREGWIQIEGYPYIFTIAAMLPADVDDSNYLDLAD